MKLYNLLPFIALATAAPENPIPMNLCSDFDKDDLANKDRVKTCSTL